MPQPIPEHVQLKAPSSPRTSVLEALPIEQRFETGFETTVVEFALPHVPSVPAHEAFPSTNAPVSVPDTTSLTSPATEPVTVEGVKFHETTVVLLGVVPAI